MTGSKPAEVDSSGDGRRAEKLIEAIANEVTLIDRSGTIISSTAGTKGALGYEPSFWRSRNVLDLAHPEDVAEASQALADLLGDPGGKRRARFRAQHIEGHWETVEIEGTNLLDDPDVEALVLTTRAVTREERLQLAHEESARAARLQSEYVANVTQALREPLQSILGVAELLRTEVNGAATEFVSIIDNEGKRLLSTINDLIVYANVTGAGLELDPRATDVRALVDKIVTAAGDEVTVQVDDAVEQWITLDELRVGQILQNLLNPTVADNSPRALRLHLERPRAGHLRCTIDTPRVDPLAGTNSTAEGSGFGVAIAERLIGLMGSELQRIEADPSRTIYTFVLLAPASEGEVRDKTDDVDPEAAATSERRQHVGRALVVDDNEVNQVVIGRQLESIGFDVDLAENGLIGVEKVTSERYQMVIMDWHMPECDGLEATRRIRRHEASQDYHTPIVAMTASAMPGDRERCLDAGMDDFLTKPATIDQVAEAVAGQLAPSESPSRFVATAPTQAAPENDSTTPDRDIDGVGATAGDEAAAGAVIDTTFLRALGDDLGDLATVGIIVETYLQDLDARTDALSSAITEGRGDDARREAHTLKSPSAMLGATDLGEFCRLVEGGSIDFDAEAVSTLATLATATRAGLEAWLLEASPALQ